MSRSCHRCELIYSLRGDRAEPSGGASGQASDIAIHAKEILRVREVLTRIYQKHCALEGEPVEDGVSRFRESSLSETLILWMKLMSCNRDGARARLLHDR